MHGSKEANSEDGGGDTHDDDRLETRAPTCIGSPKVQSILAMLAKRHIPSTETASATRRRSSWSSCAELLAMDNLQSERDG